MPIKSQISYFYCKPITWWLLVWYIMATSIILINELWKPSGQGERAIQQGILACLIVGLTISSLIQFSAATAAIYLVIGSAYTFLRYYY